MVKTYLFYCEKEPNLLVSWEEDCRICIKDCVIMNAKNTSKLQKNKEKTLLDYL
jgi:hypothetical protein